MSFGVWLTFLMASFMVSISPGAGAINTMNSGMTHGVRSTFPTILGLQFGYGIQIFIVAIGLGAVLASSTSAFLIIKWLGVAYLIWLGIQKWRSSDSLDEIRSEDGAQKKRFLKSVLVNLTNPKATVFLVALFPQFLSHSNASSYEFQLLLMGGTLLFVDVVVMFFYAVLASQFKKIVTSKSRVKLMNRIFGSFFIFAAFVLAAYKKS